MAVEQELKDQRELMAVRFDAMDRRFEETNERFAERFDAVDQRFAAVDRRFEEMDRRFEEMGVNGPTSASRRWARDPTSDSQQSMSDSRT